MPPKLPFSIYFFALSQAPPALAIVKANITQLNNAPPKTPPNVSGPREKPTIIGKATADAPGRIIFLSAAEVAISTHLTVSGSALPSKSPGISLNCLLISLIISNAASPTAVMVRAAIKYGKTPPINNPIKT